MARISDQEFEARRLNEDPRVAWRTPAGYVAVALALVVGVLAGAGVLRRASLAAAIVAVIVLPALVTVLIRRRRIS